MLSSTPNTVKGKRASGEFTAKEQSEGGQWVENY